MPELDSVRGVAILMVLFYHGFAARQNVEAFAGFPKLFVRLMSPGWAGVNLFFALSGFLITGILLDTKNHAQYYRRFYLRRALRILPAYYGLLFILAILGRRGLQDTNVSWAFLGLSAIYLANLTILFGVPMQFGILWSLAVEEHFYILWPAVVRRLTLQSLAWVSASLVILIPALRATSFAMGHKAGLDWYTWFAADGLAAGSLLAILLRSAVTRKQVWTLCGALLGSSVIGGIVGAPFGIATRNRLLGAGLQWTTIHIFCAGILLLFLLAGTSSARRYVNLSVLRFFGYLSYGLYLYHMLAFRMYDRICRNYFPQLIPSNGHFKLVLLRFVLAGGGALAIAYLSRRFFEERFLRMKDSLLPHPAKPIMVPSTTVDTQVA
jgi:peptidoglycan/LPS O-acetylase OafA/YrhL